MSLTEVVMDVQPRSQAGKQFARLVEARHLRNHLEQGLEALVDALERGLGDRVVKRAGGDGVALALIGIQQALRRDPAKNLAQLPSQVHCVLDTEAEALSTRRVMHVRRIPREQHPPAAV